MATGKVGADTHGWDLLCQRRHRIQKLRHDQDVMFDLLILSVLYMNRIAPCSFSRVSNRSDVMFPSS